MKDNTCISFSLTHKVVLVWDGVGGEEVNGLYSQFYVKKHGPTLCGLEPVSEQFKEIKFV